MFAVPNQCADGVSETAQGKIDLLGLFKSLSLHFTLADLLAACQVNQVELATDYSSSSIVSLQMQREDHMGA
jgi:hypothetical protein